MVCIWLALVSRSERYIGVVADEVFTGGGRSGDGRLFAAYDPSAVDEMFMPDAIVMGKGFCPCVLLNTQGESPFEWRESVTSNQSLDLLRSTQVRPCHVFYFTPFCDTSLLNFTSPHCRKSARRARFSHGERGYGSAVSLRCM